MADFPRHEPPSADQVELARAVNERLGMAGKVSLFQVIHSDFHEYGVVLQHGSRRRTITRSHPFEADDLVAAVLAMGSRPTARYSYEEPDEDFG